MFIVQKIDLIWWIFSCLLCRQYPKRGKSCYRGRRERQPRLTGPFQRPREREFSGMIPLSSTRRVFFWKRRVWRLSCRIRPRRPRIWTRWSPPIPPRPRSSASAKRITAQIRPSEFSCLMGASRHFRERKNVGNLFYGRVWGPGCLIDWLIDRSGWTDPIDWLIWLIDWFDWLIWLIDWLIDQFWLFFFCFQLHHNIQWLRKYYGEKFQSSVRHKWPNFFYFVDGFFKCAFLRCRMLFNGDRFNWILSNLTLDVSYEDPTSKKVIDLQNVSLNTQELFASLGTSYYCLNQRGFQTSANGTLVTLYFGELIVRGVKCVFES